MGLEIVRVTTVEQCCLCRELAEQVWGVEDTCSVAQMMVHASYGGVILLAQDNDNPVGFLFSFPSLYHGEWVLWSHETAVLESHRHQGIGYTLKLQQKLIAGEMGYQTIVWTFDPLISRNAHFNFNKLHASIDGYVVNAYGVMDNDLINQGFPTDRFIVAWSVSGEEVSQESKLHRAPSCLTLLGTSGNDYPLLKLNAGESLPPIVATQIPRRIDVYFKENVAIVQAWQSAFQDAALQLFENGFKPRQFYVSSDYSTYIWCRKVEYRCENAVCNVTEHMPQDEGTV